MIAARPSLIRVAAVVHNIIMIHSCFLISSLDSRVISASILDMDENDGIDDDDGGEDEMELTKAATHSVNMLSSSLDLIWSVRGM
jgi:hypothetical protein